MAFRLVSSSFLYALVVASGAVITGIAVSGCSQSLDAASEILASHAAGGSSAPCRPDVAPAIERPADNVVVEKAATSASSQTINNSPATPCSEKLLPAGDALADSIKPVAPVAAGRRTAANAVTPNGAVKSNLAGDTAREIVLRFVAGSDALAKSERERLAVTVGDKPTDVARARIVVGKASSGSAFEQIAVAQRRARHIAQLLPKSAASTIEFEPTLAEDAAIVELEPHPSP